jgi:hypothetical protein
MKGLYFLALAAFFLTGCETISNLEPASDLRVDLRDKEVSFVLEQDITIPAKKARLYLQNGAVGGSRDLYQPFCVLEIDAVDHQGFTITPDSFDVVRIQRSTVQIASQGGTKLASSASLAFRLRNDSESRVHDGYHFWLQSDSQPSVMRLTCYGVFKRISQVEPPTLEEIGVALGESGRLLIQ